MANERHDGQARRKIALETRRILAQRFPNCFTPPKKGLPKKALKLQIFDDIRQAAPDLDPSHIKIALKDFATGWTYLEACVAGAPRVDLLGNQVDVVTSHQAHFAKRNLNTSRYIATLREENARMRAAVLAVLEAADAGPERASDVHVRLAELRSACGLDRNDNASLEAAA